MFFKRRKTTATIGRYMRLTVQDLVKALSELSLSYVSTITCYNQLLACQVGCFTQKGLTRRIDITLNGDRRFGLTAQLIDVALVGPESASDEMALLAREIATRLAKMEPLRGGVVAAVVS